jgi:hypothetical protein
LKAIGDTVPVRLMKRDLLFVLMQTFPLLNEWRLQTLVRQHGIRKDRETDMLDKLFAAFLHRADKGTLSRLLFLRLFILDILGLFVVACYEVLPADQYSNRAGKAEILAESIKRLKNGARTRRKIRISSSLDGSHAYLL